MSNNGHKRLEPCPKCGKWGGKLFPDGWTQGDKICFNCGLIVYAWVGLDDGGDIVYWKYQKATGISDGDGSSSNEYQRAPWIPDRERRNIRRQIQYGERRELELYGRA